MKSDPHCAPAGLLGIGYRTPEPREFSAVRQLARHVFTTTFGEKFAPAPFSEFCDAAFGAEGSMEKDLHDPTIHWRVAGAGGDLVGYAKLRPLAAPAPSPKEGALELQQIYVRHEWHGTGVAAHLMEWAIARAAELGAPELYLTVFDHNHRAKRFYAKNGFADVGRCDFTLGDEVYEDRVWKKVIAPDR